MEVSSESLELGFMEGLFGVFICLSICGYVCALPEILYYRTIYVGSSATYTVQSPDFYLSLQVSCIGTIDIGHVSNWRFWCILMLLT